MGKKRGDPEESPLQTATKIVIFPGKSHDRRAVGYDISPYRAFLGDLAAFLHFAVSITAEQKGGLKTAILSLHEKNQKPRPGFNNLNNPVEPK